jgi:RNA polymerase sigma-70 factor (ECF subfamily)
MNKTMHDAISELVPYIYAIAYKLTTDIDRAQDLAQETLLTAWEKQDQLHDRAKLKGWLRAI